jgi:hypothetical protein
VLITLPSNYVVGATGVLEDSSETKWMEERARDTSGIHREIYLFRFIFTNKTIHYSAGKAHDFAWFADKRYHVAKAR